MAISRSLGDRYVKVGLAPAEKVKVLGQGASNGVRVEVFASPDLRAVDVLRVPHGLEGDVPVVGFVGRFARDKGIIELVNAVAGPR